MLAPRGCSVNQRRKTQMPILQNRYAPFALFGAAAAPLAVCYIVFWTGWMEPPDPSPILPILLAAAWLAVALTLAAAVSARSKPTRWLYVGLAGGALTASSAATYFTLFLAPLGAFALTAAAVGLILARRDGETAFGIGGIDAPSAIGAASLIAPGAALAAWAWLFHPSAAVVWTTLGLSAIGSGAALALRSGLGE